MHYTSFCAKFKEGCNPISTSHYGFVTSCLIISFTLAQYSFTTEGYKAPVIFAFMPHIIRRAVSFLYTRSSNFDRNHRRGRLLLLLLLLLLLFKLSTHLSLYRLVGHVLTTKGHQLAQVLDIKYKNDTQSLYHTIQISDLQILFTFCSTIWLKIKMSLK